MRAGDIRGGHPRWQRYLNGPADRAALQEIHGIGPERSALILCTYGSIDAFLQADPSDIAARTHGLIGDRLARRLQARCVHAGLRSDWTRLQAANRDAEPARSGLIDRLLVLFDDEAADANPPTRRRWSLARVRRAWAFTALWVSGTPWMSENGGDAPSTLRPPIS